MSGSRSAAVARLVLMLSLLGAAAPWRPVDANVFEQRHFASAVDERRYKAMVEDLRCLVCQNQNIAASDADLARDLRDRVHSMINDGQSDKEIVDFMVERYGDFVLYRPPLGPTTLLLWVGPFVLGGVGLLMLLRRVRLHARGTGTAPASLSPEDRERARSLLQGETPAPPAQSQRRPDES